MQKKYVALEGGREKNANGGVKVAVERKEAICKNVLEAKDETVTERCREIYKG